MSVHRDVHPEMSGGDFDATGAVVPTLATAGGTTPTGDDRALDRSTAASNGVTGDETDAATATDPIGEIDVDSDSDTRVIPEATVARLATYLRVLAVMDDLGVDTVSSEELACAAGVNSAKLRKDLSHVGSYGVRGVGYAVRNLVEQLMSTLGLEQSRSVALIGVGNLGQALAGYAGFGSRGFRIAALLDADPSRVGTTIRGLDVRHVDDLEEVVASAGISIAVIATPGAVAQAVCDRLAAAGVTAILNFAPVVLSTPDHVDVRKVDLAAELQILSFHEQRKSRGVSSKPRAVSS